MKLRFYLVITLLCLWAPLPAQAQQTAIQSPQLKAGQYVYTIPDDYNPPLIGQKGIQELQAKSAALHYPFFIVLVKALPGGSNQDAAKLVDGIAAQWSSQGGHYDPLHHHIFVLTYEPKRYRFLAGAYFREKLGFEKDAHKPFTDIFEASVKGTPQVPKNGLLEMMPAIDTYLYNNADPAVLAQRKARQKQTLLLIGLGVLLLLVLLRFFQLGRQKKQFLQAWQAWRDKIDNAFQHYARFQTKERDSILGLKDMQGQTHALYLEVTQELDEIALSLAALEEHFEAVLSYARKAHFLSFGRIEKAYGRLNQQVEFDTQQRNQSDLFGELTLHVTLTPRLFMQQLQARFENAQKGWNKLKTAAEMAWQEPKTLLPERLSAELLAHQNKTLALLEQSPFHPAHPERQSVLYERLEKLRWQDALKYQQEVERLKHEHERLMGLITAL